MCCTDSEGQYKKHLGSTPGTTMVSAQVTAQVSEELHKSADPSLAWSQPESSAAKGFLATNFPAMKHHLQPSSVPLTSFWCSALSQPSGLPSLIIKNHSCSLEVNHLRVKMILGEPSQHTVAAKQPQTGFSGHGYMQHPDLTSLGCLLAYSHSFPPWAAEQNS